MARAHSRITDARRDFLHKTSTRLVRDNGVIAIEDLNVAGMVRNRSLARAVSCTGWGEFRRQLEPKSQRAGRDLVVIGRWYPSSKTCSACGHRLAELSLSARHWTCPSAAPGTTGTSTPPRTSLPPGWRQVPGTAPMPAEGL